MGYRLGDFFDDVMINYLDKMKDVELEGHDVDIFLEAMKELGSKINTYNPNMHINNFIACLVDITKNEDQDELQTYQSLIADDSYEDTSCFILKKSNNKVEMVGELPEGFILTINNKKGEEENE